MTTNNPTSPREELRALDVKIFFPKDMAVGPDRARWYVEGAIRGWWQGFATENDPIREMRRACVAFPAKPEPVKAASPEGERREQIAKIITERAIGVTWEMLHADRLAARLAQKSGTSIHNYGIHQDEVLDTADAILALVTSERAEVVAWSAKAALLRSRGRKNTLHDINQAADYLEKASLSPHPVTSEPVAWTGPDTLEALAAGHAAYVYPRAADVHPRDAVNPIALYASPPKPSEAPPVEALLLAKSASYPPEGLDLASLAQGTADRPIGCQEWIVAAVSAFERLAAAPSPQQSQGGAS